VRLLSSRAARWIRNAVDRWLDRYHEGPDAPPRFEEEARLFALIFPEATAADWVQFAHKLAGNAYRQGFVRGYEWSERSWEGPEHAPEYVADLDGAFSLAEMHPRVADLLRGYDPGDLGISNEDKRQLFDLLKGAGDVPVTLVLRADAEAAAYSAPHVNQTVFSEASGGGARDAGESDGPTEGDD